MFNLTALWAWNICTDSPLCSRATWRYQHRRFSPKRNPQGASTSACRDVWPSRWKSRQWQPISNKLRPVLRRKRVRTSMGPSPNCRRRWRHRLGRWYRWYKRLVCACTGPSRFRGSPTDAPTIYLRSTPVIKCVDCHHIEQHRFKTDPYPLTYKIVIVHWRMKSISQRFPSELQVPVVIIGKIISPKETSIEPHWLHTEPESEMCRSGQLIKIILAWAIWIFFFQWIYGRYWCVMKKTGLIIQLNFTVHHLGHPFKIAFISRN